RANARRRAPPAGTDPPRAASARTRPATRPSGRGDSEGGLRTADGGLGHRPGSSDSGRPATGEWVSWVAQLAIDQVTDLPDCQFAEGTMPHVPLHARL